MNTIKLLLALSIFISTLSTNCMQNELKHSRAEELSNSNNQPRTTTSPISIKRTVQERNQLKSSSPFSAPDWLDKHYAQEILAYQIQQNRKHDKSSSETP